MRSLLALAALAAAACTLATTAAESIPDTLGRGFVLAKPGQACVDACTGAGKRAAVFRHLTTETALCAVLSPADGWTPGWQMTGSGNASCAATTLGVRKDEGNYSWCV